VPATAGAQPVEPPSWADCGGGFQCAGLRVPVDWSRPSGPALTLALVRRPATDPGDRIGSLVLNYGGPGESGVAALRATYGRLPAVVRARFDVVSFDPRGTGASRPVRCVDDAVLDQGFALPPAPATDAEMEAVRDWNARFALACRLRVGGFAGQIGTRNVARDLDALRAALGDAKLTYVGYSYGSVLGQVYAQMYPDHVRAAVLDGPPDYSLTNDAYEHGQAQGFSRALDAFLSWCATQGCAYTHGAAPRDAFDALDSRVTASPSGRLNATTFEAGVFATLYDESRGWPLLADSLARLANGDGSEVLSLADGYLGRNPDGTYSPIVQANAVINCLDRPVPAASVTAELAQIAAFARELPPFGGSFAVSGCPGMPQPAPGDALGSLAVTTAPPIVVVGTTGDPATPYAGAQTVARAITGSRLLTYESTEHTAYGSARSTCVDDFVDGYLLDGTLPPDGATCRPG
jgi:pimeloyl-ACP methyl ester carboxylesterase